MKVTDGEEKKVQDTSCVGISHWVEFNDFFLAFLSDFMALLSVAIYHKRGKMSCDWNFHSGDLVENQCGKISSSPSDLNKEVHANDFSADAEQCLLFVAISRHAQEL